MRTAILCATALATMIATPAVVWAAEPAATGQNATADGNSQSLKDIIVTAQRRTESLQRAALAITAVNGDDLRAQAKDSIAAAIGATPAVVIQGNPNGAQIYVRGVGSNADSQLGDAAVNLNVDGVYQQETEAPTLAMFDIARVEVLRGPQGTLYGRNATAGAINVITNDPTFDGVNGYATLQGGNYGEIHSEAAVNLPLASNVALRAAFSSENHDGYLSNGDNDADVKAGRLKLLVKPTDRLRILLAGDYLHAGGHDMSAVEAPLNSSSPYYSATPQGYLNIKYWNVRAQADYDTSVGTITGVVAHNDFTKDEANVMLSPVGVADRREGRQETAELRMASLPTSPVKWVAGLYYLQDLEYMHDTAEPVSFITVAPGDPELRLARTRSFAAYANVTVPLTQAIRATGGIRYTNDRKSATFYCTSACTGTVYAATTWNSVTYKAGIEADLSPTSMAYAQVSSGFKAGGYAQQFPAGTYNPERITAFEIGSKNRFADNRIQLNASAFYYNYRDYQASYADIVSGTFAIVTKNASTAKVYGLEAESRFQLSSNDTLGAGMTLLHAKFGSFIYTSVLAGTVDHSNQTLPNAPGFTAELSYEHVFRMGKRGELTAHVDSHISNGFWVSVERPTDSYQPAFTRTNAFIAYEPASKVWNARIFVRNLENTPVRTGALANPFDQVLLLAPPRTYGGALTVRF